MPQASATALNNLPAGLRAVRWDLVDTSGTSFLPWPATPTPTPQAAYVPVPAYTLPTGATLGEEFVSDTNPSSVILTLQNSYTGSLPATVQMQADRIVQDTTFTIGTPGTTPTRETVPGWVNINVNPVLKKFIVPTPIYLLRNALTGGSGFNFDTTIAGYGPGMWETDSPSIAYTVAGANLAANTTFTTSPTSVLVGTGNYGQDVDHSVNILVRRSTANANIPALSPSATNTPYSLTVAPQLGGVSPKTVPVVLWAWSSVAANVPNNPVVLSPGNNRSDGRTIINKPPAPVLPATTNFAVEQVGIKIFTTPALPWTPVSQNAAATLTDYNVVWSSPGANINFFTTAAGAQPAPAANVSFDTRDMKLYVAYNATSGTYTLEAAVKVYGEDPMDSSGSVVSIKLEITVP
jgi:hypothetical protein